MRSAKLRTSLRALMRRLGHEELHGEAMLRACRRALIHDRRFRDALANLGVALAEQDRELRYVWAYKPFGATPADEMVGRTDADLLPADNAAALTEAKLAVIAERRGMRQILDLTTPTGRKVLDIRIEPVLGPDGCVTGVVTAALDITNHQQVEDLLRRQRDEAEAAVVSKSRAIARASHDLRQPFQAMRMFHEVLSAQLQTPRQQMVAARLGEAMAASEELLTNLLELSTFDSGPVRIHLEEFPVADVLAALDLEGSGPAAAKGLRLRVVPSSARIVSDRVMLTRLMRNLLVNAIRYTRQGGIVLGARRRGDEVLLEVWDTGIGIPPDQIPLIFEDFYRGGNVGEAERGLGLGLAGVARLSRVLAHPVTVRSVLGRGSVFSVAVPGAAE